MNTFLRLLFLIASLSLFSQEAYYNGVNLNLTGLDLKNALATKITDTHVNFLSYTPGVWEASKSTDVNPSNANQVLLIYGWESGADGDITNDRTRSIDNNGGGVGQWNREHVYSRSLGTPNLGESGPGADAHHLRPSDVQRNSSRGNKKFANGSGNSGSSSGGWYPGDEWKGDVARMMMYMYLRYGDRCLPSNVGIGSTANTPDEMIDLFLQWNADDPVSDLERQRNAFHENTNNTYAQGNRNPFIDNPRLATRIWGGPEAEDTWGIYSGADNEAPSVPSNLRATDITTFSIDLAWNASTDNVGVSSYDVFVNGDLFGNTSDTQLTITDLNSDTSYSLTVLAKDIADNKSAQSSPLIVSTLADTSAPTVPSGIVISNETTNSFVVSWQASSDNTGVTAYDIYIDGNKNGSTDATSYTVLNLDEGTAYSVQILAKDAVGNSSALSDSVIAQTTNPGSVANELFFSEYVEGSSNNKALELVNLTENDIDLSVYSIKRQRNGGQDGDVWGDELNLTGTIEKNDVYVIINANATLEKLIDEADFVQPINSQTNFGGPVNFNGNDPVGLFKNDVLIDIIGTYNGGSSNFAKDKTLIRKASVSQPNTSFDLNNEWEEHPQDMVDNIGSHSATLSATSYFVENIRIYPNPTINKSITLYNAKNGVVKVFSPLGKLVSVKHISKTKQRIELTDLSTGVYYLQVFVGQRRIVKRILLN